MSFQPLFLYGAPGQVATLVVKQIDPLNSFPTPLNVTIAPCDALEAFDAARLTCECVSGAVRDANSSACRCPPGAARLAGPPESCLLASVVASADERKIALGVGLGVGVRSVLLSRLKTRAESSL